MIGFFSFLNPAANIPSHYQRQVYLSNLLSFIFSGVTLGVYLIFRYLFGNISTLPYIVVVAVLFLAVPLINRSQHHRAGRMLFCLIPVLLTMFVTIHFKLNDIHETYIVYFDSRFILMAAPILPGLVFRLEERTELFVCLGTSAFCIIFYDLIHEAIGAGYYQRGFTDGSYYYINYIVSITFLVLVFGILLMRSVLEHSEAGLEAQNRELQEKQNEIEAQHEELLQHQEEVMSSSEKLESANALIMEQQNALEKYNLTLEGLVTEKSQDLKRANDELVKYNNELLQFSYTVSHNLRGPVARLLGLTRLFKDTHDPGERQHLEDLVLKSSQELDEVLKDLSLIIDIRNEVYRVREKVFFDDEWKRAIALLGENVKPEYRISADFSGAPYIFGVRPMIQSVLYNLLSNAIKYQSPDRPLEITARSFPADGAKTVFEIRDNGLGFDLASQEKNVFKLYKRFHSHVAGKGLGLYLVKTQVEALDGKIDLETAPDHGTTFSIAFTKPDGINKQVFHDTDAAQLYYDGHLKVTVIQWKRNVTSEEYRQTFSVVFDSLKIYRTPGWISDLRKQGPVADEDQRWLIKTLATEAIQAGLKQIAVIGFEQPGKQTYYQNVKEAAGNHNVRLRLCSSMEEALSWMEESLT